MQAMHPGPNVVVYSKEDAQSVMPRTVHTVGIYGGTGCGKTSCLTKTACMSADNQWPGLGTLPFWTLPDPKGKQATDLKQLLRGLDANLSEDKCEQFADFLTYSNSCGVHFTLGR